MAFQTSVKRKTRQQKIQASARQTPLPSQIQSPAIISNSDTASPQSPLDTSYAYVIDDLKKISWITIICLVILAVATLLISDINFIANWRSALHLPTL